MIKFSLDYIVPEGEFCETLSRKGINGERTGKVTPSCDYIIRDFDNNIKNPVTITCMVFNKIVHHEPGIGVFKCQKCQDKTYKNKK